MWTVQRWRLATHAGVALAILAVALEAKLNGSDASPLETAWTLAGATGLVYGLSVLAYRGLQEKWRRVLRINGRVKESIQTELVMSGSRTLIQVLITISGIAAMKVPEPVVSEVRHAADLVSLCVLGIGIICTFKTWYAERRTVRIPKPPEKAPL